MNLRADEISSLIQKQIEGFEEGIELKETGRVISVGDGIARIYGLGNSRWPCRHGFEPGRRQCRCRSARP